MQTDEAAALKAARTCVAGLSDWNRHRDFILNNIVDLVLRQCAEAVAAATPEIERRARLKALEDVEKQRHKIPWSGHEDCDHPECIPLGEWIEAEIKRLKGETKET